MPYFTIQLQQVLCKNKKLGEAFSSEVNTSVSLRVAYKSNQPSLMAPSRAPRDTQTVLASSSPEMINSAPSRGISAS